MISSIFGKTKPVVYVLLLGFLFLFYWSSHLLLFNKVYPLPEIAFHLLVVSVLMFSVFVVNFIVSRNQITGANSFAMLYFSLLVVLFPETLVDANAIFCAFFLLLATRRLISMRSERELKMKIFDAALWIAVAALFYNWALLYLTVLFVSIYFYGPKDIRNWLIPLSGVATVYLIDLAVGMTRYGYPGGLPAYDFGIALEENFRSLWEHHTKLLTYATLVILVGFATFLRLGKLGLGRIITMRLIAVAATVGLLISLFETDRNSFPVIITFFPAAAIFAKYVETIRRKKIRELALALSIVLPLLWLTIQTVIK